MRGGFLHRVSQDREEDFSLRELNRQSLGLLGRYLRPYTSSLALAVAAMLVVTLAILAGPLLIKIAVDRYIVGGNLGGLNLFLGAYLALYLAFWIGSYWQRYLTDLVGQQVIRDIRRDLTGGVLWRPMTFFDRTNTGHLVSRIVHDVEALSDLLSTGLVFLVNDLLTIVGIGAVMFAINTRLAAVVLLTTPLIYAVMVILGRAMRRAARQVREAVADLTSGTQESVSGIRVIQSLAQEGESAKRFSGLNEATMQANLGAASVTALFFPIMSVTGAIGTALVVWFGGQGLAAGTVTLGTLMAFLAYVSRFFAPLRELSQVYSTYQAAGAALERIGDYLSYRPEEQGIPGKRILEGRVEFRGVTFSYDEGHPVLEDLNLTIASGETVALVGETGAGKTTITDLLLGLYRPDAGVIGIDDAPVEDYTREELRRKLAVVPQDTFLFPGTIADNIAYARPEASGSEVREAARAVQAHGFISGLPRGYETEVGERGVMLSGGQKQLIAFARAMIMDPRILILDEATSSVDAITEHLIQQALGVILEGRTSFIIAHRFSTVKVADRVCVISNGRLAAEGSHEVLWEASPLYRELCAKQWL